MIYYSVNLSTIFLNYMAHLSINLCLKFLKRYVNFTSRCISISQICLVFASNILRYALFGLPYQTFYIAYFN